MSSFLRGLGWALLALATLLGGAWGAAALWIDGPASRPLSGALAAALAAGLLAVLAKVRPLPAAALVCAALLGAVLLWWLSLAPRMDRDWAPEYAQLPSAEIDGDRVTIRNLRHFAYHSETDFEPRWETRGYDLAKLTGLDLFMSHWGSPHIAHTILSWQFAEGPPLAISIETRRERGEGYSALRGFFRQFELYYVVADERDLVELRTSQRGEDVYLYRLRTPVPRARAMLLSYLEKVNRLAREPDWYNAFSHNCTTSILVHTHAAGARLPVEWELLANGHLPALLYRLGALNRDLPFAELRARSAVSAAGKRAPDGPDWSARIREGLPERPPQIVPE
jgi:hypothetical protein